MAHVHIIGQSGSGKSTLMKQLMVDDMKDGNAVLFIDPHGPDTDDLLHYVPRSRIEDTVLFDPAEPIQWNPLLESDNLPLVAQLFFDSAHAAWRMGIGTPTMEMMLQSLVYTALLTDRTVYDAFKLIRHPGLLKDIDHALLKDFWEWYGKKSDKDKDLVSGSTYNKLYTLFLDDRMRRLFDTRSGTFRFSDMMNDRITLVRLPQGQLGLSKVSLVGSLILSQIQLLAQNRDTSVPLSIYIDECHLFAPTVLAEMLTGIRKYNVRLTLAHQTIEQVGDLFGTISGNCSTRYGFRISSQDADYLHRMGVKGARDLDSFEQHRYRRFPWDVKVLLQFTTPLTGKRKRTADAIRNNTRQFYHGKEGARV